MRTRINEFTHTRARKYKQVHARVKLPKFGNFQYFKKFISLLIINVETKNLYVRNLWIEPVNMRQGVGACGRVWGHVAGSEVVVGGQANSISGNMWQKWDGVVGCGGMWQGVGECDRGGSRVWGHVAGVGVCSRGSGLPLDWDMWWGWGHVVGCGGMWQGVGACGRGGRRVWGHVAGVGVFGWGSGLWHGWGHVVGVGACGRVWGYVAGCRGVWYTLPHAPTPCHTSPSM